MKQLFFRPRGGDTALIYRVKPACSARVWHALRRAATEHIRQRTTGVSELQRHRIQAVPLTRRWRTIRKNVSEMTPAACAYFLHANHAVAGVAQALDVRIVIGAEETRPAGAGVELRVGAEERQSAEAARLDAVLLVNKKDTAEGSFSAVLQ